MRKQTTTKKLNLAIINDLLQVKKAECSYKSSSRIDEISKETFRESLGFLCESGVFTNAIGWHYERDIAAGNYEIETGRMNPDSEIIITVYLEVCSGVNGEDIERALLIEEMEE